MLASVTAILPNRGRAAQRHEVPVARQNSKPGKHADIGAFGGRRFATAEAWQTANEPLTLRQDRIFQRGCGLRLVAQPARRRVHTDAPATGSRPCATDLTLPLPRIGILPNGW